MLACLEMVLFHFLITSFQSDAKIFYLELLPEWFFHQQEKKMDFTMLRDCSQFLVLRPPAL